MNTFPDPTFPLCISLTLCRSRFLPPYDRAWVFSCVPTMCLYLASGSPFPSDGSDLSSCRLPCHPSLSLPSIHPSLPTCAIHPSIPILGMEVPSPIQERRNSPGFVPSDWRRRGGSLLGPPKGGIEALSLIHKGEGTNRGERGALDRAASADVFGRR